MEECKNKYMVGKLDKTGKMDTTHPVVFEKGQIITILNLYGEFIVMAQETQIQGK